MLLQPCSLRAQLIHAAVGGGVTALPLRRIIGTCGSMRRAALAEAVRQEEYGLSASTTARLLSHDRCKQ